MTNAVATVEPTTDETVIEFTEPTEVADAPVAQADSKYASDEVRASIASRLIAARQAGWSRTKLQELTELTPAQLWRCEQGNVNRSEVAQIEEALAKIDAGDVQLPPRKGKIGKSQAKIDKALALLIAVNEKLTKKDLLDVVSQAVEALNASDEDESSDAPSA
jgi:hypothetical protein